MPADNIRNPFWFNTPIGTEAVRDDDNFTVFESYPRQVNEPPHVQSSAPTPTSGAAYQAAQDTLNRLVREDVEAAFRSTVRPTPPAETAGQYATGTIGRTTHRRPATQTCTYPEDSSVNIEQIKQEAFEEGYKKALAELA